MLCERCGKQKATIHINEKGSFCLECNNEFMTEQLGLESRPMEMQLFSVKDPEGNLHVFEMRQMLLPGLAEWTATEVDGNYEFNLLVSPEEDQEEALGQLQRKVITGVGHKSLRLVSERYSTNNAISIGEMHYRLENVGSMRIDEEPGGDAPVVVIDGKRVAWSDLGRAMTVFSGFNLVYQIHDPSEEVLGAQMALKPISIDPEHLFERFEQVLNWFLDRNFLSYRLESPCEVALYDCFKDLELLARLGEKRIARTLGERMKKRLLSIEHDTDTFPDVLMEEIERVIS